MDSETTTRETRTRLEEEITSIVCLEEEIASIVCLEEEIASIVCLEEETASIREALTLLVHERRVVQHSISQRRAELDKVDGERSALLERRETLGFFKRRERKEIDKQLLPMKEEELAEIHAKIEELTKEETAIIAKAKQAEADLRQIQQKKQQAEEEKRLKEEKEAEERKLAEEKRKEEENLRNLALQGDAKAQYDLSLWYRDEKKDITYHVHWLQKAAGSGHVIAQRELGLMYLIGNFESDVPTFMDWDIAFGWLEKAAENEDAEAQYHLARLSAERKDKIYWLERAAAKEHKLATFLLALILDKGDSPDDHKRAFKLFTTSLEEHKNPLAYFYLGEMYCTGKGTLQNPEKGKMYLFEGRKKCELKFLDPRQACRIGLLCYGGKVTGKPEFQAAEEFLERAAVLDDGSDDVKELLEIVRRGRVKEQLEAAEANLCHQLEAKQRTYNERINDQSEYRPYEYRHRDVTAFVDGVYNKRIEECRGEVERLAKELAALDRVPTL